MSHKHPAQQYDHDRHPKMDFQVERLAFFSDAVIAIALTLLVLEIKLPEIKDDSTPTLVLEKLLTLWPGFLGLFLSFILIGLYWSRHHYLFMHIHSYNNKIIVANMLFLMPIILFPFTLSFYVSYLSNESIRVLAVRFFALNQVLALSALFYLYWLILVKHPHFIIPASLDEIKAFRIKILVPLLTFSVMFLGTFFTNDIILPVLSALAVRLLCRFLFKEVKFKSPEPATQLTEPNS